jgi:hypothetical protein
MFVIDFTSQDKDKHHREEANTNEHMEPMETGHRIVEAVKEDLPSFPFKKTGGVGIDSMMDLRGPFKIFIEEEEEP